MRNHISPFLGKIKVGALDADILDAFYAELRRCRNHCAGRSLVQHRTTVEHGCDERCAPHRCRPLGATTIRHMHFILWVLISAVRWEWVTVNPLPEAQPPAAHVPNPHPPSAVEAARIVNEAWKDPDKGVDGWAEGDPKTHPQRRVALDPETVEVLSEHHDRCRVRAEELGIQLPADAFVFSGAPDGSTHPTPGALTQRYNRLAERLGIDTNLHRLRHYSATELRAQRQNSRGDGHDGLDEDG